MATVYALIDGFVGTATGDVRLRVGEEYDTSDPLYKAHPDLFTAPEHTSTPAKKTPPRRK
jgi:hypothetical protein